jgi:hypothetical protein
MPAPYPSTNLEMIQKSRPDPAEAFQSGSDFFLFTIDRPYEKL